MGMSREEFEAIMDELCGELTKTCATHGPYGTSKSFEEATRSALQSYISPHGLVVDLDPHPFLFPDIVVGKFGIEVKFTEKDTWRSVANSISEGFRSDSVESVYLLFGKMGGHPEVAWNRYEDCVIHVRTSHRPRFEVQIGAKDSLFTSFGISYEQFVKLPIEKKMVYIRDYARDRLKTGERLWWLEDKIDEDQEHSLPLEVRLYTKLPQAEKRKLRAEAALLCPQIVKPSGSINKYGDVAIYLLTYHGILCSQVRDLYSAGSVALRADDARGGIYVLRALKDIEKEMLHAAAHLEDALFQEYWGRRVAPRDRIVEWLRQADKLARTWKPSHHLFQ